MKRSHLLLCGAFIVAGVVLATTGAEALAVLPAAGCMLMMGMMIWMMRPGGHDKQ